MPGQPILSTQTGNPRDTRVRMAPQPYLSGITGGGPFIPIGDPAAFFQAQVFGGSPALSRSRIVDNVLHPSGKPLASLSGKWNMAGGPLAWGTGDPGNILQVFGLANLYRRYTFATPVGTGSGYLVNFGAGYAAGSTSIVVDTGTGTILAGDVVVIGGVKYKVATGISAPGTLILAAPGLRASVLDNAPITLATYNTFRFGLSESTRAVPWFTMDWNGQVNPPARYAGTLFMGLDMQAQPNAPFLMSSNYASHAFSLWGDVVQTVGSGSTLPRLIGTMPEHLDPESEDEDIYLKWVSFSAKTMKAKRSSAGSYGADGDAVVLTPGGYPVRLRDQWFERIGEAADQARAYIAGSPTGADADEFKVPRLRAPWAESLPTRRPLASTNVTFLIDGEPISIPGGVQTATEWDGNYAQDDTPGAQGRIVETDGTLVSTVTPSRRITDRLFQDAIFKGANVSCVIDVISAAKIGNTLREFRHIIAYPRLLATGQMHVTNEGGTEKGEAPILIAEDPLTDLVYPDGFGGTYTFSDPVTHLIETDLANPSGLAA